MQARTIGILLALLALTFLLAPLVANFQLFDQKLHTEVAAALEPTGPEADYLAILEMIKSGDIGQAQTADADWQKNYTRCTSRTQVGCLRVLREDLVRTPLEENARLQSLLEHYRSLVSQTQQRGNPRANREVPAIPWSLLLRLSNLSLASSVGIDAASFLSTLEGEIGFWKEIFTESDRMLDKVVAVAALWSAVQYSSEYILLNKLGDRDASQLAAILAGAELDTGDMQIAYLNEFRNLGLLLRPIDSHALQQSFAITTWQSALLLQPVATLNEYYGKVIAPLLCLAERPVADASAMVSGGQRPCDIQSLAATGSAWWSLYNPAGKSLMYGSRGTVGYIFRVHDFNALRGMVEYQLAIQADSEEDIYDYLSPSLRPTVENGKVSFPCLEKQSLCEVKIRKDQI